MPDYTVNLISIIQLFKISTDIQFSKDNCKIKIEKKTIITINRNGYWFLNTTFK